MTRRPPDESSASPPDAANDPPDQTDPAAPKLEATVDVTPGDAGQTVGGPSADRVESTSIQEQSAPEKTRSDLKLPLGETDADLGATVDSPSGLSDNTASEAADEPLGQTVDVAPTQTGQRPPRQGDPETGQAPTPIREITGHPATRHTVTRFLAEGGLGKVYVVQDDELQREVVMKTLKDAGGENSEARYRFVQEAQVNSQLEHPNIVPIYQAGRGADGLPYYTMKYVRGQEYRDLIQGYHQNRREGNIDALELRRLLTLFISTCQAVSYAHNRGVVHRDLKPENVAVGEFGELMVLDWGLAKVLGEPDAETSRAAVTVADGIDLGQTMQGRIMGTPGYMAPEQASGETDSIEPRTDVYSLGAMLFEILTGEAPHALLHNYGPNQLQRWSRRESHSGTAAGQESVSSLASLHSSGQHENTMKLLARVVAGTVPAPSDIEPTVPRALEAICQRAMSLQIEDRYTTASDLAGDVERWLADEPVTVYAGSWNERLGRWMRKHRTKVQAIGASFAVIALVAVVSSVLINNQKQLAVAAERIASQEAENAKKALAKQRAAERGRLVAQVDRFCQATAAAATIILSELDVTSADVETALRNRLADSRQSELERNRIRLALLKVDPEQLDSIFDYLQSERSAQLDAAELLLIRAALVPNGPELAPNFESLLSAPRQRLRSASLLAGFAPQGDWCSVHAEGIAADLVRVLPSQLAPYRDALRPIYPHLVAPLTTICRDSTAREQLRSFATDTLADYLSGSPDGLFELLSESNQAQFLVLYDRLSAHRARAIELGNAEITKTVAQDASEDDKDALAVRQANAAVMLLRMESADAVWSLLQYSHDPRVRSYIVHWLGARGGDSTSIIARFREEADVTIKRALLLCLGECDESRLSEIERNTVIESLLGIYRNHTDAGLHGAAEWLLKQWKQGDRVNLIDRELQQTEEELRRKEDRKRDWYINGQGQTYVIVNAGEFQMGSLRSEPERFPNEIRHRRQINRQFAICSKEVTKSQWRPFSKEVGAWSPDQEKLDPYVLSEDSPIVGLTWYEATWYCNWLSEREGIPKDQWCYLPNEDGKYAAGMKAKQNFLALSGYRLPTEPEWEYACRAGSVTSRYFGQSVAMLPEYSWYQLSSGNHTWPVGSLKPNAFGLFDMLGNAFEWCYDANPKYPEGPAEAVTDSPTTEKVSDTEIRVLRGGSFLVHTNILRSAYRHFYQPGSRLTINGFRTARTYLPRP